MSSPLPDKDTYLDSQRTTTNNGDLTYLSLGQYHALGSNYIYNVVLEWDLTGESLEDVGAITSATMNLLSKSEVGTGTATVTVSRLGINFLEEGRFDGCNWIDNGEPPTGDQDVAWVGGYIFAMDDVPETTFTVGTGTGDAEVDLLPFVKDAIQRRSGILRLVLRNSSGTASNYSVYHSTRAILSANRPTLDITVASRVTWTGSAGDGNASNGANWSTSAIPTSADYVMFNTGSEDVTSGSIQCYSLFVGREYTGQIGLVDDVVTVLSLTADKGKVRRVINKNAGQFFLQSATDLNEKMFIVNAQLGSVYTNATYSYETNVAGGNLELVGDSNLVMSRSSDGRSVNCTLSGTPTDIKTNGGRLTLENGCDGATFTQSTRCKCTGGSLGDTGSITVSGKSSVHVTTDCAALADIEIFRGRVWFKDNESAAIITNEIYLWKNSVLDTYTGIGTWSPSEVVTIKGGGNFIVDVGKTLAIS